MTTSSHESTRGRAQREPLVRRLHRLYEARRVLLPPMGERAGS